MKIAFDILRWAIAILSVAGTLALIGWIAVMFFRKDPPRNDNPGNRN
jgi:hypothetical protein